MNIPLTITTAPSSTFH